VDGVCLATAEVSSVEALAIEGQHPQERVEASEPGAWVTTSSRWHESQLAEQRFPRRDELDRVSPGNPLLVRRGGHNVVVNSLALARAGIDERTPNPPEGTYVRDPETGRLTGHIIEVSAFTPILQHVPPLTLDDRLDGLRRVCELYRAVGLTSVRLTVSSPSTSVSLRMVTANVLLVSPAANDSVPEAAV
jgi:hypothetical protein